MEIVLPKNTEIVGKLERKLAEYKSRVEDKFNRHVRASTLAFIAPEETSPHTLVGYKIAILDTVLAQGRVNVDEFKRDYWTKHGPVEESYFRSAVNVISNYCGDPNTRVYGGTGLK